MVWEAADAADLERRLLELAGGVVDSRFLPSDEPHLELCAGLPRTARAVLVAARAHARTASLSPMGRRWILIALVLAVAGCGGDDDSAVREDPKTVGTTTAEQPPPESTDTAPRETTTAEDDAAGGAHQRPPPRRGPHASAC